MAGGLRSAVRRRSIGASKQRKKWTAKNKCMASFGLSPEEANAVSRSALAGSATAAGAALAVLRSPGPELLALLLGSAGGVMGVLASYELIISNCLENGVAAVLPAACAGAAAYALLAPLVPQPDVRAVSTAPDDCDAVTSNGTLPAGKVPPLSPGKLLRLGVLLTGAMGLHNLPEGFTVALSAGSQIGPLLAIAIALHNISEGAIVAGPLYAATNSRPTAFWASTLSGLAEPAGALAAVLLLRPSRVATALPPALGVAGGLMASVTVLDLLPEGLSCRRNNYLIGGALAGGVAMALTLALGA